ncbi:signal peptidase I [uncultured Microbulbifer sp.]|uniref:signal peptidase I n=1 Tax=uncultured Microbulbifer sp. TaxID=348147 RepID=UPI0026206B53|nr:signal peptidase I [uncultured Microbulbifer sp.]
MKTLKILGAFWLILLVIYFWNPSNTNTYDLRARVLGFMFYHIPSASMHPTVKKDGYIFVSTFSYIFSEPKSGEMIVYRPPHTDRSLLGRVMGASGDKISVSQSLVTLNGVELEENYINDEVLVCQFSEFPETIVPEGYLFILGDNRCNSLDSRSFGFVPDSSIVGKVIGRI